MIRINLIPVPKVRKQEKLIVESVVGAAVVAVTVVVCILLSSGKESRIDTIKAENQRIQSEINKLKAKVGEVEKFKQKLKVLKDQLGVINNLQAGRTGPVRMMDELTDLIPREVWLSSFREQAGNVQISGLATDGPEIADFLESLKRSKYFSEPNLVSVQASGGSKGEEALQRFQITMNVKYNL